MKIASQMLFAVTVIFAIAWTVLSFHNRGLFQDKLAKVFSDTASPQGTQISEATRKSLEEAQEEMRKAVAVSTDNLEAMMAILSSLRAAPGERGERERKELAIQIIRLTQMQDQKDAAQERLLRMQAEQDAEKERILQANITQLLDAQKEEANKKYKPMPITISAVFGLAALFVVLFRRSDAETKKWAIGTLGVITGFWLGGV